MGMIRMGVAETDAAGHSGPATSAIPGWDAGEHARLGGSEAYEISYFAKAAGITQEQARLLFRQHGSHRASLLAAARRLKLA